MAPGMPSPDHVSGDWTRHPSPTWRSTGGTPLSYRRLLDSVDAALHRLADHGLEPVWAPLGAPTDAVPKTNLLTPQSFGQFGHLGHPGVETSGSAAAPASHISINRMVPRSRRVLLSGDQTAQKAETAGSSAHYAWAPGWAAYRVGAQSAQEVGQQPGTERARAGGHDLTRWLAAHPSAACPRHLCPNCGRRIHARSIDALPVLQA